MPTFERFELPWSRPFHEPGGDDAYLLFAVFGVFPPSLELSPQKYRSVGAPVGVATDLYRRESSDELIGSLYAGWIGQALALQNRDLMTLVEQAPMCLVTRGRVEDPASLDYLRDVVGLITAMVDSGGVAILDRQAFLWYSAEQWRERIFDPDAPVVRRHVSLMQTADHETGQGWLHTRGLRKFGRPDLSIRGITPDNRAAAVAICNRLIERLALGAVLDESGEAEPENGQPPYSYELEGSPDDPDFNNEHYEITLA